jgi:hypothetical protein
VDDDGANGMMRPGQRLYADQQILENGAALRYQGDGNLVLYGPPGAMWATGTSGNAGRAEMQTDGNLVVYNAAGVPIWATMTSVPGSVLHIARTGLTIIAPGGAVQWEIATGWVEPEPEPPPVGVVRRIQGYLRQQGRSLADNTGPRIVHGCSDFAALAKFHEDPDTYLRNLDVTAQWQQYTRLGWRCNGWRFTPRGLDADPLKHAWWESALWGVLDAHRARGLKVSISSFDMNDWTDQQALQCFQHTAHICKEFGDTVWLSAITNEMHGTWRPGESDENVAKARELMRAWTAIYPGGLQALSDPDSRSKAGMKRLGWTAALIHQFGTPIDTGLRRAFNDMFENYPDVPIDQNEPRGPNGDSGDDVTNPIEDPDHLFALYTMHVLTGQASTYFNGPGAATRAPLDSTWGFKELPQLWRILEIPEDIGQGRLCAGQHGTFMQVHDSHASRADGMRSGAYGLGAISGVWDGSPWAVRAGYPAEWSVWYADSVTSRRPAWEGQLSEGQAIPTPRGFTPAIVRALG